METNNDKSAGENKSTQNPFEGFDFNKLLDNPNIAEILKHLASGGGAVAVTYFIWIQSIQKEMEEMNGKIKDQEKRINELEKIQEKMAEQLSRILSGEETRGINTDYFNIKRQENPISKKYRNAYL